MSSVQLNVRVPEELLARLRATSVERGVAQSVLVREGIALACRLPVRRSAETPVDAAAKLLGRLGGSGAS